MTALVSLLFITMIRIDCKITTFSLYLCMYITGVKCPPPPPMPPNHVCRQDLLDEMFSKLCQSNIDPDNYGTSLTVTGAGGFGKTSIFTAFCHYPVIKKQFTDGVVFIELGQKATDPSTKLCHLYHLLTGKYLKQGDINHAEQEIYQLTSLYCRNLLVIIDDVWHVEDAEPIVKAFSNCKIVLTTRMNDIVHYIPTQQIVSVGPMEKSEAMSLLTSGVIDISKLSQEDVSLLDELAQDVHLWPLLLSLVRGQLSHNLKMHHSSCHEAIQTLQAKLHRKGLTAFDKNNIDRSRKYAVEVCIKVSLEFLTTDLLDKFKCLIIWTGIGSSLQIAVLQDLWSISDSDAKDVVDALWAYGLVQFSSLAAFQSDIFQSYVEVHAVISQYIIEKTGIIQVITSCPNVETALSMVYRLIFSFNHFYGIQDENLLPVVEFLEYTKAVKEFAYLPTYIRFVNMLAVYDPNFIIFMLYPIWKTGTTLPQIAVVKIKSLIDECCYIIQGLHRSSRKLNQAVQKYLTQMNYPELIKTVKDYTNNYPIPEIANKAVACLKDIQPNCEGTLLNLVTIASGKLLTKTSNNHQLGSCLLPYIKLHANDLMEIDRSLCTGSPDVEITYHNLKSGKSHRELEASKKKNLLTANLH